MRAWHVDRPGPVGGGNEPLVARDTPVPVPGPGELLLLVPGAPPARVRGRGELLRRVLACGVCRTDLHVTEGDLPVHRPGVTPGHEVVGEVAAVGPDAGDEFAIGDRVGIAWLRHTCGHCKFCIR